MSQGPFGDRRYTKTSEIPSTSETYPNIYSGVATDYLGLKSQIKAGENHDNTLEVIITGFYSIIDAPFSFVADTILLPYTIYRQYVYGDIYYCYLATKCSEIDSLENPKHHDL